MNPEPADMRHRLQSRHEFREPVVVEQERVATGENHLMDRRICRDRFERRLDPGLRGATFRVGKLAAEAVAAVDRAATGRQQKHAASILLYEPRRRQRMLLLQGIGGEACHVRPFSRPWQHLQQQRIVRVTRPHPGDEPPRHEQRKITGGTACTRGERRVERQHLAELFRITDGVSQFSLPAAGRAGGGPFLRRRRGWRRLSRRVGEWQGRHGNGGWPVVSG